MAKIVLGLGTSHGPMLSTPPELWGERVKFDRTAEHFFRDKTYSFDELVSLRAGEPFNGEITQEIWQRKHAACRTAISRLADIYADAEVDAAVIVGNDQMEVFTEDVIPAVTVFWGKTVENIPWNEEQLAQLQPGVALAAPGHCTPERTAYETLPDLGRHIIESLIGENFDVAASQRLPVGPLGTNGLPHAFGFVYRQIMRDRVTPNVPIFINTFYPPNQPKVARCIDLGAHLVRAIESWPSDARIALIASGGLSHFVIDEEVDRTFLDALRTKKLEKLEALGEGIYQSGTSEIKNWIPVAGAMAHLGFTMQLVDYQPCYRSAAGTGNAMGFVAWHPN